MWVPIEKIFTKYQIALTELCFKSYESNKSNYFHPTKVLIIKSNLQEVIET